MADDLKGSAAWQVIDSAKQAWRARLPDQPSQWFVWLVQLPQAELIEVIALCTALTLNALPQSGGAAEATALAGALGLDMADWWEPTAQSYLNHVPKALIVQALEEGGVEVAEARVEGMKKVEMVTKAAAQLAGKRWLPSALRSKAA